MATKATIRQARYDSTHCTGFYLKLHNVNDADIMAKLATVESKQGYIKQLIRQDIGSVQDLNDTLPVQEKQEE